jgi:D-alanine---D-serine ligase
MKRTTIAVLFGGCSSEYEISLQSASAVIQSMNPEKYDIVLLGITRQGEWRKYSGPIESIQNDTWGQHGSCVPAILSPDRKTHGIILFEDGRTATLRIDAAFPVLHGKNGEDGTVQGLLALAGIPCVGCGTLCSALCMDKDIAHRLVKSWGINTPPSVAVYAGIAESELIKLTHILKYPLFVKPANAGSSFGITMVTCEEELPHAADIAFLHDRKIVIEEAVDGFEVGCAVLGNNSLITGEVDEIELKGFFDFAEKYTPKSSVIHMPARIDKKTSDQIRQTAVEIYRALGCSGFARIDLFLTPDKEIVFNEVNTIPGFTLHSRYPNMMKGIGMDFTQIIDTLIELAVEYENS